MDRLAKEHDGFYRTSGGFCAVVPKLASGITPDGMKWFVFRLSPYGEEVRIEWPKDDPLAVFDNDTAVTMIRAGYGRLPTDAMIEEYNQLADTAPVANSFPPEGWIAHPSATGFYYKGQEVLSEADLRLKVK